MGLLRWLVLVRQSVSQSVTWCRQHVGLPRTD